MMRILLFLATNSAEDGTWLVCRSVVPARSLGFLFWPYLVQTRAQWSMEKPSRGGNSMWYINRGGSTNSINSLHSNMKREQLISQVRLQNSLLNSNTSSGVVLTNHSHGDILNDSNTREPFLLIVFCSLRCAAFFSTLSFVQENEYFICIYLK